MFLSDFPVSNLPGENTEVQPGAPDPTMRPFNPDVCPGKLDTICTTGDGRYFALIGKYIRKATRASSPTLAGDKERNRG